MGDLILWIFASQDTFLFVQDCSGPFGLLRGGSKGESLPCIVYSNQLNKAIRVQSGAEHVMILTEKGDILTFGKRLLMCCVLQVFCLKKFIIHFKNL